MVSFGALLALNAVQAVFGQTMFDPDTGLPIVEEGTGPGPKGCDPCELPYMCDPGCDFWLKNGGDCERPHQEAFLNYCGFKKYGPLLPMRDACPEQCNKPKQCKPFCSMYSRRDKACTAHEASCSGCSVCLWKGKGFTPEHKTCPKWCSKYMFLKPSPAVNPGDKPGCYDMPGCQGCSECNWSKVQKAALAAQKDLTPLEETLTTWGCNDWCTQTHKPKNLCTYNHCKGCPSCKIDGLRRLNTAENSTAIETPYVSV